MIPAWLAADPLAQRLPHLSAEEVYDLAEQAAIMELDGGVDRATAEMIATGGG